MTVRLCPVPVRLLGERGTVPVWFALRAIVPVRLDVQATAGASPVLLHRSGGQRERMMDPYGSRAGGEGAGALVR
ncbi:hypothetical protein CEF21_05840 [Bacillus sp. FJAT-42376]|nr:hypothetical protein CEF21_05840 [Bacillus sp. FJAT-42376]